MEIIKKYLTNGQYLTTLYEKKSLFLHHTEGLSAMSAWRWWNATPARVGTPYIVDRDGTIYECFDPAMWAFHLGVSGDDNWHEKHSVNIEIVSAGRLHLDEGKFIFYPLYPNKMRYNIIPKEDVYTFKKPWREHSHYHMYTDAQLKAVQWLIKEIVVKFPTIKVQDELKNWSSFRSEILTDHLGGIWPHSAVRKDKDDLYPSGRVLKAITEVHEEIYMMQNSTQIKEVKKVAKSKKPKS